MDKQRALQILAPRYALITEIFLSAWARWWANPERPVLFRGRTRPTLIHNYIMLDGIPKLKQVPGVLVNERYETAFVLFDDLLVGRFKKGDANGLSTNIPTGTALAFTDPEEDLNLFGLPDVARVDFCYCLNALETKIDTIKIVSRDRDTINWCETIYDARADQGPAPVPTLPVSPLPLPPADEGLRVPASNIEEKVSKEGE